MSEIAVRTSGGMTFPQKLNYSQELANSSMLPRQYQKNPANILFALEYAEALGLPPISAITSIYVVEGKPTASADLIASMVRKAGHRLRVSGDDTFALAQIIRADDPDFTYEARWDLKKAQAAGLAGKGVWRNYPGAMLRARAITEVARMGASDSLYGVIYSPEELGAEVNADGDVISAPSTRPAPAAAVEAPRSAADRLRASMRPAPAAQPAPEPEPPVDTATGEVIDAEIVPDEPAAAPEGITKSQLTAINAAMGVLFGFTDREDKLAYLSGELGRDITSSAQLSKAEASQLLDKLRRAQAEEDEAAAALADAEPMEPVA